MPIPMTPTAKMHRALLAATKALCSGRSLGEARAAISAGIAEGATFPFDLYQAGQSLMAALANSEHLLDVDKERVGRQVWNLSNSVIEKYYAEIKRTCSRCSRTAQ